MSDVFVIWTPGGEKRLQTNPSGKVARLPGWAIVLLVFSRQPGNEPYKPSPMASFKEPLGSFPTPGRSLPAYRTSKPSSLTAFILQQSG